ncbi:hypothetical protein [Pedobacter helvus]|uniref:Uncharacterized protein n=1 Tax=Pedobacter helvus TaxID=2563444 RepID=A0ABW9JJF0_9SPHI|nr:hypothetical protein [Pedobacter ureilyticus]
MKTITITEPWHLQTTSNDGRKTTDEWLTKFNIMVNVDCTRGIYIVAFYTPKKLT